MLEFYKLRCEFWYDGELIESSEDTILTTKEEIEKLTSTMNIKEGKQTFNALVELNKIGSNAVNFNIDYFRSKPFLVKITPFLHTIIIWWHSKIKPWKHIATYQKKEMSIMDMLKYRDGEKVFQYFKEHNFPVMFTK